ncbi:MAG TPA: tripartite tricarboxylate transporter substrate-binding protein, partial [Burkholderiales bacterium]|nr:tripartite tricarboxylate transporter substrate-binding protein [Burkholderiales bacterium]
MLRRFVPALFAGALLYAPPSVAQTYPLKPIRIIVPLAEGGASGLVSRRPARGKGAQAAGFYTVAAATIESYPIRTIRLIVPLAPGGGNDTTARIVGHKLAEAIGQQVVVDNRPGGGSVIASDIVAKSAPDGYTLYLVSTSFTVAPALHSRLPFDSLRDFAPITRIAIAPGALIIHRSLPVNSVRDLIALAKAR